jgi:hypothetical protein
MTTYDEIKAVNFSTLKHLATSPLLYRWRLDHPRPQTAALTMGLAIHCAVLEPEKFDSRYAVFEGTRRGKEWDEWQAGRLGVQSLKPAEIERVQQSAKAVRSHRVAAGLLSGCRREEPLTWTDAGTGLACKGRVDAIAPGYVLDLKSARDVMPRQFERAAAGNLYHAQLAFYHDGAAAERKIDGTTPPYVIAVQSAEPYDVAVFQYDPSTIDAGRALYRSLLHKLIQCTEADFWPGCAPDLNQLMLPPWAEQILTEEDEF